MSASIPSEPRHRAPRVAVVGAGGTIAMHGAHPFDWVDYGDTGIVHSVAEVLATAGEILPGVEIVPVDFRLLASTGITPTDWCDLAAVIDGLFAAEPTLDGVVVTHGTASLEETAFFLALGHRRERPVVLTGAQRPPNTTSSDAIANLRAAVAVAAAPVARGLGVVVVMNGEIHAAADVTKGGNHQLDAFVSPEFGPLGRVEADGTVTLPRREADPLRLVFAEAVPTGPMPRVDIAWSHAGADGVAIDAFVGASARAIVSAGFPPGRAANGEREALIRAANAGVLVVQASRARRGVVPDQAYNRAVGILGGGRLPPHKVRILVMRALALGLDAAEIQRLLLAA